MIEEEMSKAANDDAARAGQGDDGEKREQGSNSVNTELRNAVPAAPGPVRRRRRKRSAGRRSRLPKKVLRVTTYERLGEYLVAFAEGHFHPSSMTTWINSQFPGPDFHRQVQRHYGLQDTGFPPCEIEFVQQGGTGGRRLVRSNDR